MSNNVSIEIATCSRWSRATYSIFFTISVSLMLPSSGNVVGKPCDTHEKIINGFVVLKVDQQELLLQLSMLDFRTCYTLTRWDLIPSQANCEVRLVERDANISGGTARSMAANTSRSSRYSIGSPSLSLTACYSPCACRLTRINKAHLL